ncbi:unnamed protein product [Ambrosiozyma monospora]|uniref:Unnamed protein product n=1 Tax=Ambrosiozyma monospora TaxID=43982 RepID=A0ACB5TCU6_AMBMO|nr:unnamed protein product [Ambrosiozyma monospora]
MRSILSKLNNHVGVDATGDSFKKDRYFAFFNSGPESGYSQFHKHVQFMKLPADFPLYQDRVVSNAEYFIPNELKADKRPLFNKDAGFKHFILKMPRVGKDVKDSEEEQESLAILYMYLVKRVLNIFRELDVEFSKISYNFIMTDTWMMIVPRKAAHFEGVWQNSLGYMGLFGGKNEEVLKKYDDLGYIEVLKGCGFEQEEEEDKVVYNEYGY